MKSIRFVLLLTSIVLPLEVKAEQLSSRCNVLFIIVDDLNSRIEPFGDPDAITPNLTRLAQRSVTYRNCVCQYSLCFPSRASFLTGIHPWNLGVHQGGSNNAGAEEVIPGRLWMSEYFRSQGYWAGSYGKVEHDENPEKWDELIPRSLVADGRFVSSSSWSGVKGISGNTTFAVYDGDATKFTDGVSATGAMAAMERCIQEGRKFFVTLGFYMPHPPWLVPKSIADLYDPAALQLPANPPGSYDNAYWPPYAYAKGKAADTRPFMPEEDLRDMLKAYYSATTLMDYNLGRVLDFADANGLWDDTVIILASDNGFSLMEHRHLYSKRNYSRESVHVPMMIHHPGMTTEGQFCDRQVGLIDILPTALDLAGVSPYPKPLDGQSIAPLQEDPNAVWDRPALSCLTYPRSSMPRYRIGQLGPWKLIEGPFSISYRKVMDHANDPLESYGTFPNGIDGTTLAALEAALSEIPFENGVFYTERPLNPDRDADGLSDEGEIDLGFLGFSPYIDNTDLLTRFTQETVTVVPDSSIKVRLESLPADPEAFSLDYAYPLQLERSYDLETWQVLALDPELGASGHLEWEDDSAGSPTRVFYRASIGP